MASRTLPWTHEAGVSTDPEPWLHGLAPFASGVAAVRGSTRTGGGGCRDSSPGVRPWVEGLELGASARRRAKEQNSGDERSKLSSWLRSLRGARQSSTRRRLRLDAVPPAPVPAGRRVGGVGCRPESELRGFGVAAWIGVDRCRGRALGQPARSTRTGRDQPAPVERRLPSFGIANCFSTALTPRVSDCAIHWGDCGRAVQVGERDADAGRAKWTHPNPRRDAMKHQRSSRGPPGLRGGRRAPASAHHQDRRRVQR